MNKKESGLKVTGTLLKKTDPADGKIAVVSSPPYDLFGGKADNLLTAINKVEPPSTNLDSNVYTGVNGSYIIHPQPASFVQLKGLKDISTHHSACIQAKKYSTVGMGFFDRQELEGVETTVEQVRKQVKAAQDKEASSSSRAELIDILTGNSAVKSRVSATLDAFTLFGFQNELLDAVEDFLDCGTGYLEVSRDESDNITGISYVAVEDINAITLKDNGSLHLVYEYIGGNSTKYFALFGDKEWLVNESPFQLNVSKSEVSEIIPFIMPSNRVRYYGYPDWLAAAVDINLTANAKQYKADFYANRGVLDFITSITGGTLGEDQITELKNISRGATGNGKRFRSAVLNIQNPEAKVNIFKLAADMKTEEQFAKDNEVLAQNIVSSHRVPPLLANILIPGKLGASNEFVNALIGFQLLVVGPYQNIIQSQLARTLGNSELNGGLALDEKDFRLRTITSQINITGLDTVSRSRSEATAGDNANRDYSEGVKD